MHFCSAFGLFSAFGRFRFESFGTLGSKTFECLGLATEKVARLLPTDTHRTCVNARRACCSSVDVLRVGSKSRARASHPCHFALCARTHTLTTNPSKHTSYQP